MQIVFSSGEWWSENGELQSEPYSAFHLSELSGQTIPFVMRISLLIKTVQADQSIPK